MSAASAASLWDAFATTVRAHGPRTAFIGGDSVITFEQWMNRALDYADWFIRAGGRAQSGGGERALLIMRNSPEMAAAMCGIWAAGGVIALLHADSPPSHVAHAIDLIQPRSILVDDGASRCAAAGPVSAPSEIGPGSDGRSSPELRSPAGPNDPASIVFTSGSTGRPKGVVQSHGNLLRGCRAVSRYLGIDDRESMVCPIPWSFDYGVGLQQTTLILGTNQVLPESTHPGALCESIARHRPTMLPGVPSLFAYLFSGLSPIRDTDLSSVRIVSNTGGAIAPGVLDRMLERFAHCRIYLNYGLTESYRTSHLDPALVRMHPASIGRAIPGVQVAILRDDGAPAEPDEEGQIIHRGDYVFLGYWNDPRATAEVRRPDPLWRADDGPAPPALFTGDYGRIDGDGLLYLHGRRDRRLKSMGVRVSPEEVETLLHQSGLLVDVAVFGRPHDLLGDEIWAAVVPAPGLADIEARLAAYARGALSPAMTPRRWLVRSALPRTPSGKTDYPALDAEASRRPSASLSPAAAPR